MNKRSNSEDLSSKKTSPQKKRFFQVPSTEAGDPVLLKDIVASQPPVAKPFIGKVVGVNLRPEGSTSKGPQEVFVADVSTVIRVVFYEDMESYTPLKTIGNFVKVTSTTCET